MTKDVIIAIAGLQFADGEQTPFEMIAPGTYYSKNDKHYVIYDELITETGDQVKNTIKIGRNRVDVMKKGGSSIHMVFEPGKKTMTYYSTPFGELLLGINTLGIQFADTPLNMDLKINYTLEMNYAHVADCNITVNIKSKEDKGFTLQ